MTTSNFWTDPTAWTYVGALGLFYGALLQTGRAWLESNRPHDPLADRKPGSYEWWSDKLDVMGWAFVLMAAGFGVWGARLAFFAGP